MNIFENYLKKTLVIISKKKKDLNIDKNINFDGIIFETPPENFDFDLSSNLCLVLAKKSRQNPRNLAISIKSFLLENLDDFEEIEVAGPGFLNFRFNNKAKEKIVLEILKIKNKYGSNSKNFKYNIEFVSANPTGPLHVGHCRGAIYGDVLSNLLNFNGNKVTKEYYINDYGNQINNFAESVYLRLREIKLNEKFVNKENLYPGNYIIDIAKKILNDKPKLQLKNFNELSSFLKKTSLKHSMDLIKKDLKSLGIKHDNFISETSLIKKNMVEKSIKKLEKKKFVNQAFLEPPKGENKNWKKSKKLVFKSTLFGDDMDRALKKEDGSWTYFANDIAYHNDKVSRKFNFLINILGADHTGYTKRITAAVKALSDNKVFLECKVCQLVKLYKNNKPYKMSKRSGDFISVSDLLKEVNKDSIRFMMLNRSNDVELDFDFDKILEKTKDNPVFYVQYCYARISSIFRTVNFDKKDKFKKSEDLSFNTYENKLFRKILDWPKIIDTASKKLEPHRIPFYLYDLATLFHSYWSKGNEDDNFKFIKNGKINSKSTLLIITTVALIIENGMKILGVSLPKKM